MDKIRIGNFTSSEIVALTTSGVKEGSFGKPAFTYIEECNMERRLGRALENEVDAKGTSWGKLVEPIPFQKLGLEYTLCSSETLTHPDFDFWLGTPDARKVVDTIKTVGDIKCPLTLKSFCRLVDPFCNAEGEVIHKALTIEAVRANHKDGEKFYWQIVSNAILTDSDKGELIVYVPYKKDLDAIRNLASSAGEMGEYTKWVYYSNDDGLPHLIEGGHYKDVNVIEFDIPEADKDFLTDRVKKAGKLLKDYSPAMCLTN